MEQVVWGSNGFKPWRHQIDGLNLLREHDSFALLDDVGCGKTAPLAVRVGEILAEAKKTKPNAKALIIAEQTLIYQWPSAIREVDDRWDARWITGKMTAKEKRLFWANPPDILCTNYEYIKSIEEEIADLVAKELLVVVVCDEAHNLCGYRGPRSKTGKQAARIIKLTRPVPYKYAASASMLDNPDSPRVWGPYNWLEPALLPATVSLFERSFFDNFSNTWKYKQLKLKPSMVDELSRRIKAKSRRILMEETGAEVPERIINDVYVQMSPKLRKAYRSLQREAMIVTDDRPITRSDVLARNAALLQVASGFIIDSPEPLDVMAAVAQGEAPPEYRVLHIDTSHKDKALEALCKDLSKSDKVIVWAHHTHEIDHLQAMLNDLRGGGVVRVDGSVTGSDRANNIRRFQDTKSTTTFLGQPGACGAGLNLQVAQHMVRWSRSHFITDHNQSYGRNRRAVRDQLFKHIVYHSVMTDQTVDVRTEMRNRGKREFAGQIMLDHLSYEERNLR
jgi:SNF2 family DNA or RNA helicase